MGRNEVTLSERPFWTQVMRLPQARLPIALIGLAFATAASSEAQVPVGTTEGLASQGSGTKQDETFRGRLVLFGAERYAGSNRSIATMRPDGTGLETVLALSRGDMILAGRIAPDGRRLAFSVLKSSEKAPSNDGDVKLEVWLLSAQGQRRKITDDGTVVAWSPDGSKLICCRGSLENLESFAIELETGLEQRLPVPKTDRVEDMSPDGKLITVMEGNPDKFFRHPDPDLGTYPIRKIYRFALDDGKRKALTTGPMQDNVDSCFSPDGKWIAYTSRRYSENGSLRYSTMIRATDGNGEEEVVNFDKLRQADGAEMFRPSSSHPRWSPDGKLVVSHAFKVKWEPSGKAGSKAVRRTTFELLFASPGKGLESRLDLPEKGIVWMNCLDWR
jgi:Tol biopolymer transport system component